MSTAGVHSHGPINNLSSWFLSPWAHQWKNTETLQTCLRCGHKWGRRLDFRKVSVCFFPVQSTNLNPWENVDFDNQLLSPEDYWDRSSPMSVNTEIKNYIFYPPPVLTSQNSTASFPNNTVTPLLPTKISRGGNNWQLLPSLHYYNSFISSGKHERGMFCWDCVKGSSSLLHAGQRVTSPLRNSRERMGEVGVQWNTAPRSYLMGTKMHNYSMILTSNLCKLLESERENLVETHNGGSDKLKKVKAGR